jgi:benzil reductase ((S)-benzoin forming)
VQSTPLASSSIAVVTGHSRGLGSGIALGLLERDIAVVGISRGDNPSLAKKFGVKLREIRLDLSDADALAHWLESGELRRLLESAEQALLVNNAGLLQPIGALQQQEMAAVARAVSVNVSAALVLSAAHVAATVKAKERRILHISSGAARHAYAGWSVYCATKAALDHHARAVQLDRTPRLRISSLAPGVIDTDMQAEVRATPDDHFPDRQDFVEMKRDNTLKSPDDTGRDVVAFLLSEKFGDAPTAELPRARSR